MSSTEQSHHAYAATLSSTGDEDDSEPNVQSPNQPEGGNIDKIREILFGGQMRDYEKRFSRLEERLIKDSAELREETTRLFATLEAFIKKEIDALTEGLNTERYSREGTISLLSRELHETRDVLAAKLQQSLELNTRAHRELRQQILDQSRGLAEEMRRKYDELAANLNRQIAELSQEKTDRASLSALFTEVAMRLNSEFKIPGDR
ncbi:MAG TPA: hypothetical protein VJ124_17205 [Pyrinomonadaceae bacterium]|nr:hypothetical protein [Pyrinomonadaceae bacterium]